MDAVEVTRVVVEETLEALPPDATRAVPGSDAAGTEPGPGERPDDPAPGTGPKGEADTADVSPPAAAPPPDAPREEPAGLDAAPQPPTAPQPTVAAGSGLAEESVLTAGLVDDNAAWADYLAYLENYAGAPALTVDVSEAYPIFVVDAGNRPVLDAAVTIPIAAGSVTLRTMADGRALFFPRAYGAGGAARYPVSVTVNGETVTAELTPGQTPLRITHPAATAAPSVALDLLFVLDATGSMGDELRALKDNLHAIAGAIATLPAAPDVRYGLIAYRDRGDQYVTRAAPFTPRLDLFAAALDEIQAGGGGDTPEDLNSALHEAVTEFEWREGPTVRLALLIGDAPPHLDYADQAFNYADDMLRAAERGIKFIPVGAGGLNAQGEYIFRQLGQITGGRFVFLTYGAAGPGSSGGDTDLAVSGYSVETLDALLVRLVGEELAFQTP